MATETVGRKRKFGLTPPKAWFAYSPKRTIAVDLSLFVANPAGDIVSQEASKRIADLAICDDSDGAAVMMPSGFGECIGVSCLVDNERVAVSILRATPGTWVFVPFSKITIESGKARIHIVFTAEVVLAEKKQKPAPTTPVTVSPESPGRRLAELVEEGKQLEAEKVALSHNKAQSEYAAALASASALEEEKASLEKTLKQQQAVAAKAQAANNKLKSEVAELEEMLEKLKANAAGSSTAALAELDSLLAKLSP